jgi:hypothetical protein
MAISTNSIIHYTNSFEILSLILSEGFKIKYCAEILNLGERGISRAAHPMISFCDIPLSDSEQHFDAYGRYGIGLSKQWAMKNGVNPVLYIDKDSLFAKSVDNLLKERRKSNSNLTTEQKKEILQIKNYAKNYSGELRTKHMYVRDYRFYDEREWRLIPDSNLLNNEKLSISLSIYEKRKDLYNRKIEDIRIKFVASDISYIIVDNTEEIPEMIDFLRRNYSNRCTATDLDILFSKICSTEQIISDY